LDFELPMTVFVNQLVLLNETFHDCENVIDPCHACLKNKHKRYLGTAEIFKIDNEKKVK